MKYHQRGAGQLAITCRDAGRCYEFRVQDDGPGIAPEYHQKIFLLFRPCATATRPRAPALA